MTSIESQRQQQQPSTLLLEKIKQCVTSLKVRDDAFNRAYTQGEKEGIPAEFIDRALKTCGIPCKERE